VVVETELAAGAIASDPLASGRLAHFGGLGRLRERPTLLDDTSNQDATPLQAERGVSVQLHPDTSLRLGG
jgi:hypothetical protein